MLKVWAHTAVRLEGLGKGLSELWTCSQQLRWQVMGGIREEVEKPVRSH